MLKKALAICAASMLVASGAYAGIPDCTASSATGGGVFNVGPGGSADVVAVSITLLDFFNNPIAGFPADSLELECAGAYVVCDGATAVQDPVVADADTDVNGQTTLTYSQGGFLSDGYCNDVGIIVHDGPNTCVLDVATRTGLTIRFYDLNASGDVGAPDFGFFASHWLGGANGPGPEDEACNYDNNDNGGVIVGAPDFGFFAGQWLKSCTNP